MAPLVAALRGFTGIRGRYLLHAAGGLSVLLLGSFLVRDGRPLVVEEDLFRAINGLPDFLYEVLWLVMQGGNFAIVPVLAIALLALRRWRPALAVLLVGAGKYFGERAVKAVVVRHRPAQIVDDVILRGAPAVGRGYLSGHVVVAIGIATVLHPWLGRRMRIVVWTVAGVVCFGRMYVGAHLPLDVVGGAALGWALGSLINAALVPSTRRNGAEKDGGKDSRASEMGGRDSVRATE